MSDLFDEFVLNKSGTASIPPKAPQVKAPPKILCKVNATVVGKEEAIPPFKFALDPLASAMSILAINDMLNRQRAKINDAYARNTFSKNDILLFELTFTDEEVLSYTCPADIARNGAMPALRSLYRFYCIGDALECGWLPVEEHSEILRVNSSERRQLKKFVKDYNIERFF